MIEDYVKKTLDLLDRERRCEVEEAQRLQESLSDPELQRQGRALLRLRVADTFAGVGGRMLFKLESTRGNTLPAHRLGPGDLVLLRPQRAKTSGPGHTGVVFRAYAESITVALDDAPEDELAEPLRLDRVANDVTYQRMKEALERLRHLDRGPAARLRDVLFFVRDVGSSDSAKPIEFLDSTLNESQRAAVSMAMEAREVALVHGPPGTGKTTTVVEIIRQAVRRRERVLACAPSNVAVDNLTEKLAAADERIVRVGHPARLLPSVLNHSLDALIERSEGARVAVDVRRDLERIQRRLRKIADRRVRRELRSELGQLRRELRTLERSTRRTILTSADVVLATTVGVGSSSLDKIDFDVAVIDEAAQALEPACWIAALRARRVVLAGDHQQLPPTIISQEAARDGLAETLFDRLMGRVPDNITAMLTTQYRMHETIMRWSSDAMYDGRLDAHVSVAHHILADLPDVRGSETTTTPLLFIDTAGRGFEEEQEQDGVSTSNPGEVELVGRHVEALIEDGVPASSIAVITPYNAQVDLLRRRFSSDDYAELEIDSVDGFQGREKESVVISLVRSNPEGSVGFLTDDRRTNVAITRARRHVALIGDSATIAHHPFLARLVAYCEEHGNYKSAWEY